MDQVKSFLESLKNTIDDDKKLIEFVIAKLKYVLSQQLIILSSNNVVSQLVTNESLANSNDMTSCKLVMDHIEYISIQRLQIFNNEEILLHLKKFLRTSAFITNKKLTMGKKNISSQTAILSASIIYQLYKNVKEWPIEFMELYLDDSLSVRQWVDCDNEYIHCYNFILNIEYNIKANQSNMIIDTSKSMESYSSSDEEILEEGTDDFSPSDNMIAFKSSNQQKISDITNRFNNIRNDIENLIIYSIYIRCGVHLSNPINDIFRSYNYTIPYQPTNIATNSFLLQSTVISGTWTLVMTISKFSYLPIIRLLGSYSLDKWINNPAIMEYIKQFLFNCVKFISNQSLASFLLSDIQIVKEILKLKSRIKMSYIDIFKSIILDFTKINETILLLVINHLIEEDVDMNSIKSDTIKFIIQILTNIPNSLTRNIDRHVDKYNSNYAYDSKYIYISTILGKIINLNITSNRFNKLVIDIILRVIKNIGCKQIVNYIVIYNMLLNKPMISNTSTVNDINKEVFLNIQEFIITIQLLLYNEIVVLDKELDKKSSISTDQSLDNLIDKPTDKQIDNHLDKSLDKPVEKTVDKVSDRSTPIEKSINKRSASNINISNNLFRGASTIRPITKPTHKLDTNINKNVSKVEITLNTSTIPTNSIAKSSVPLSTDQYVNQCRSLYNQLLQIFEVILQWIQSVYKITSISFDQWNTYIESFVGFDSNIINKCIDLSMDKTCSHYIKEFGSVSDAIVHSYTDIIVNLSSNWNNIETSLQLLDHLIQRSIRTLNKSNNNLAIKTFYLNDLSIISKLLMLSLVKYSNINYSNTSISLFVNNIDTSVTCSEINNNQSGRPAIQLFNYQSLHDIKISNYYPNFVHKTIYWKIISLLYLIGCYSPSTIGIYLWNHLPSIQILMLMSMTNRYTYQSLISNRLTDVYVTNFKSNLFIIESNHLDSELKDKYLCIYRSSLGVDIFVYSNYIIISKGKTEEIISSIEELEKQLLTYYLTNNQLTDDSNDSSSDGYHRMTTRSSTRYARDMKRKIMEEQQDQERLLMKQKREIEKQKRAQRAANRRLLLSNLSDNQSSNSNDSGNDMLVDSYDFNDPMNILAAVASASSTNINPDIDADTNVNLHDKSPTVENDLVLELTNNQILISELIVPSASSSHYTFPSYTYQYNDYIDISNYMLCNLCDQSPVPSEDIIQLIKQFDNKYNIDKKLRSCTEPDFISLAIDIYDKTDVDRSSSNGVSINQMINKQIDRSTIEKSLEWLIPAIIADIDLSILSRLSYVVITHICLTIATKIYKRFNDFGIWQKIICNNENKSKPINDKTGSYEPNIMFISKHNDLLNYLTCNNEYITDTSLLFIISYKLLPYIITISDNNPRDAFNPIDIIDVLLSDAINQDKNKRGGCKLILCLISKVINNSNIMNQLSSYLSNKKNNLLLQELLDSTMNTILQNGLDISSYLPIHYKLLHYKITRLVGDNATNDMSENIATYLIALLSKEMDDDLLVALVTVFVKDFENNNEIIAIKLLSTYLSTYPSHSQVVFNKLIQSNIKLLDILHVVLTNLTSYTSFDKLLINKKHIDESLESSTGYSTSYLNISKLVSNSDNYCIRLDLIRFLLLVCFYSSNGNYLYSNEIYPIIKDFICPGKSNHNTINYATLSTNQSLLYHDEYLIDILIYLLNNLSDQANQIELLLHPNILSLTLLVHILIPIDIPNYNQKYIISLSNITIKMLLERLDKESIVFIDYFIKKLRKYMIEVDVTTDTIASQNLYSSPAVSMFINLYKRQLLHLLSNDIPWSDKSITMNRIRLMLKH